MPQFEEILYRKVSAIISFNCGLNLGLTVVQVGSSVSRLNYIRLFPRPPKLGLWQQLSKL